MLDDELSQLSGRFFVSSERQVGLEAVFERGEPQLAQAGDLGLRERLIREVGQRVSPPERERLSQPRSSVVRPSGTECATALVAQALEAPGVDRFGIDGEQVARLAPQQEMAGIAVWSL